MHAPSSPSQQLSKHTIRYAIHHEKHRFQRGFSLLELVVVMGILAIFASVSLTFVGEKDVQQRYQQSIEKLQAVKRNFFSVDKFQGQTVMHGFFVDNGLIDKTVVADAVNNSLEIILNKKVENNNHYMPFTFVNSIPVDDVVDSGDVVISGAGLYKGIRPGGYDLSEYRDSNQEIRDAWGEKYLINFNDPSYDLSLDSSPLYKNIGTSKNAVSINTSDLTFDVANLEVTVENLPANKTFKIALITFENIPCKDKTKKHPVTPNVPDECVPPVTVDYWKSIESDELTTVPSGNIFTVKEEVDDGLVFNNEAIKSITPAIDALNPEKLTNLTLTTDNSGSDKTWQITELATPISNTFTFPPVDISIGSHVLVLLEENPTDGWILHEANGNHIFEYLHIFPGQIPEPITLSIP